MKDFVLYAADYPNFRLDRFYFFICCLILIIYIFSTASFGIKDSSVGILVIIPIVAVLSIFSGISSFHATISRFLVPTNTVFRLATNGTDTVLYIKRKGKVEKVCLFQPKITYMQLNDRESTIRINEYEMKSWAMYAIYLERYLKSAERKRLGAN